MLSGTGRNLVVSGRLKQSFPRALSSTKGRSVKHFLHDRLQSVVDSEKYVWRNT